MPNIVFIKQLTPVSFSAVFISETLALGVAAFSPFEGFKPESPSYIYVVIWILLNTSNLVFTEIPKRICSYTLL